MIFSCKKIDRLTNFYIDSSIRITLDTTSNSNTVSDIWTFIVNADYTSLYIENNSRTDLSETIVLDKLLFKIASPEYQNLSILKSAEIYISTDKLEEKKIAWVENINDNLTIVEMETSEDNIQDYILNNQYVLRCVTTGRNPVTSKVIIDIQCLYLATADLSQLINNKQL